MAAVAAPRPEAEPVTIAHKPSFDIRISSCCFWLGSNRPWTGFTATISRDERRANPRSFHYAEFILCLMTFMPPPHAALRTALVTAMAFAHHKAQEKTAALDLGVTRQAGPVPINIGERSGGE
jgi:hypothetical protein